MSTGQGRGKREEPAGSWDQGCWLWARREKKPPEMPKGVSVCQPCPRPWGSVHPLLDPILTIGLFPRHARASGNRNDRVGPPLLLPSVYVCVCVCVCVCLCVRKNLGLREEETKFEFRKIRKNNFPLVISGSLFDA